eukprot:8604078-Lingulodinium_polyedra.AAC.1
MWEEIQCETDFLAKLPPAVWATVTTVLGDESYAWQELRSDVLEAVRVSVAYLHRNAYGPLEEYPMKLFVGDCRANVEALSHED